MKGWTSAIRELAIIVTGVLIALWVSNWNARRTDARLEREYVSRLAEDLRSDTSMFRQTLQMADSKLEYLRVLGPPLRTPATEITDTLRFLIAIARSANLSWSNPPVRSTTFEELETTGYLRLISDPRLRARITDYYFVAANEDSRIEKRRTGYGAVSYQLVPHLTYGMLGMQERPGSRIDEDSEALRALSSAERKGLVERARASRLRDLVQAEENFGRFYGRSRVELQRRAVALLEDIEQELGGSHPVRKGAAGR
ncbi:MAG TPA: hypothetical protein VF746_01470 [Longimicrobium sp.]